MRRSAFLQLSAILIPILAIPIRPVAAQDALRESCGDLEFAYTYEKGATLSVFGVPVIVESAFWIVNPTWTEHYFGGDFQKDLIPTAVVEPCEGGKKITLHLSLTEKKGTTAGTQTFLLLPGNRFIQSLEFTFSRDVEPRTPVVFEWNPALLNATLFAGNPFTVVSAASASGNAAETRETLPRRVAFDEDNALAPLATNFKTLTFNSLLGPIAVVPGSPDDFQFLDYRKGQWADANRPALWIGSHEVPVEMNRTYSLSVEFQFPAEPPRGNRRAEPAPTRIDLPIERIDNALAPNWGNSYIIPTPKQLTYTDDEFPLTARTRIYIGHAPAGKILDAVRFLNDDLERLYGMKLDVVHDSAPADAAPGSVLLIGSAPGYDRPAVRCAEKGLFLPLNDEGYCLFITNGAACIAGRGEAGAFYGVTSLLQLVTVNERGVFLRGARIVDYPTLDFRGIHCFTGKDAGDQTARAIHTLLARFKINTMIWECQHLNWKSHPEVWNAEYGMSLDDARKVVDSARRNFVELIPLVQSLSHSQWMFGNKQNLEFCENPAKPDAYNPLDPAARQMVCDVYREAIDLFQPRSFHIGHDEVFFRDRLAHLNKDPKTLTDVIMDDTLYYYHWLRARGIRTMLWSDMFLYNDLGLDACNAPSAEEARRRRDRLPKDVVITDWHYEQHAPARFRSLKLFMDEGFEAIGASWFRPPNIATLAEGCAHFGARGFLKTTWAGYNFQIDKNPDAWVQYGNNILAGQYAWTGVGTPADELPFNFRETFQDLWFDRKPVMKNRPGARVDLRDACNLRLDADAAQPGWAATGNNSALAAFPVDRDRFGETRFRIAKNESGQAAVLFDGMFNPPGEFPASLEIPLKQMRAAEVHFLLTATHRTGLDSRLGEVLLRFDDGTEARADLLYGKNIFAWDDLRVGNDTRVAWKEKTPDGGYVQVNDWTWRNPSPEKHIESLRIQSFGRESSPILLAVTLVDPLD